MPPERSPVLDAFNAFTLAHMAAGKEDPNQDGKATAAGLAAFELSRAYNAHRQENSHPQANQELFDRMTAEARQRNAEEAERERLGRVADEQRQQSRQSIRPLIRNGVPLGQVIELVGRQVDLDQTIKTPEPKSVRKFMVEAYVAEAQQLISEGIAEGVDADQIRQMVAAAADTNEEVAEHLSRFLHSRVWLYQREKAAREAIRNHEWDRAIETIETVRTALEVPFTGEEKKRWRQIVEAVGAVANLEHVRRLATDFMGKGVGSGSSGAFPDSPFELYLLDLFYVGKDRYNNELQKISDEAAQAMTKVDALSSSDAGLSASAGEAVREASSKIRQGAEALWSNVNNRNDLFTDLSAKQVVLLCVSVITFVGGMFAGHVVQTNFPNYSAVFVILPTLALTTGAFIPVMAEYESKRLAALKEAAEPLTTPGTFPEKPIDKAQREQLDRAREWIASSDTFGE